MQHPSAYSQDAGWFAAHMPGEGACRLAERALPRLLARGSLMLEFSLMRGETNILPLLHLSTREDWPRFLSLSFTEDGHIALVQRQGQEFHALSIDASADIAAGGQMRLTWSWDGPNRQSLLTLEALDRGTLRQRAGRAPLPMPLADLKALATGTGTARIGPRVDWLAMGDHVQPAGPGACFAPSTPIETPNGTRPAGSLQAGDVVETVDAGPQEVLWSGRVSLPSLGSLRPVRLCAPNFGETQNLWLMPYHRVVVGGPAIEYTFGKDEVLAEARHLVDGCTALQPERPNVLSWHGILLAGHHLLIADGCQIESLAIGGLAQQAALARTTALAALAEDGTLPRHKTTPRRIIRGYEVTTLGAVRALNRGPVAA